MNIITSIAEPLALGFSTGTWCVMYCAPVIIPFLLGREKLSHRRNLSLVGLFLGGRLAAYIIVGLSLGAAGLLVMEFFDPVFARHLSSFAYFFCGLILLASGFGKRVCGSEKGSGDNTSSSTSSRESRAKCTGLIALLSGDRMSALLAGVGVGLHICPPFWTAAVRSAATGNPASGACYFILFYAGTVPFFLPLLGIPFFSMKIPTFRRIARMTQILVGGYFLVLAGLVPLLFRR